MSLQMTNHTLNEGQSTDIVVRVHNRNSHKSQGMVIAVIGLPGGMKVRHEKLQELVSAGLISFYEITGRELILYWRDFDSDQTVLLSIDTTAEIPGSFTGPASRTYLYYDPDNKYWVNPLSVDIAPFS